MDKYRCVDIHEFSRYSYCYVSNLEERVLSDRRLHLSVIFIDFWKKTAEFRNTIYLASPRIWMLTVAPPTMVLGFEAWYDEAGGPFPMDSLPVSRQFPIYPRPLSTADLKSFTNEGEHARKLMASSTPSTNVSSSVPCIVDDNTTSSNFHVPANTDGAIVFPVAANSTMINEKDKIDSKSFKLVLPIPQSHLSPGAPPVHMLVSHPGNYNVEFGTFDAATLQSTIHVSATVTTVAHT